MDAPSSLKASSHTSPQFSGAEADQAPDETKGIELNGVSTAQDSVWGAEEVIEAYAKATKPTPTSAEDWPMALNGFLFPVHRNQGCLEEGEDDPGGNGNEPLTVQSPCFCARLVPKAARHQHSPCPLNPVGIGVPLLRMNAPLNQASSYTDGQLSEAEADTSKAPDEMKEIELNGVSTAQ
ncbi:hypothetical protein ONZ51_g861 [Trametes cubensis]|uniref:Uncharacterized protein n=1 Tax=Trametes cubensis TaxID=1111947 RepID=A0AAD7U4S6_9APHY|nr:hypothetical protein ONZ51_g861 [Trametes cubensis]